MIKIIPNTHLKVEKLCGEIIDELGKLSRPQLADLLHECGDKLVVAKGSERVAVELVQIVALAMIESTKEDE